ncbi:RelA/SpoT domain-containing protein [Myxococcus sp. K15C18031901]|uniref:RelA/SpoT domain-containing protein n=1 Tax=Myxococcus dinghuensis TaxID=2906761 RepID=UPI0020A8165B|nr:RelA/SpoT domain-containing protein [Myxococcus dinghuensis]MCP3105274.1 RelA/SpoT domain-containing protein [Myxococcus dinghuensis]
MPTAESQTSDSRLRRLVDDHFPWSEEGTRPDSWDSRQRWVHRWLEARTAVYRTVATSLLARVEPLIASLEESLPTREQGRFFARVDASHVTKSPESILEKMLRRWKNPDEPPPISFHNLDQLTDLGRFRIVANFLGDVATITQHLAAPYDTTRLASLTPGQRALREEFILIDNNFEDHIWRLPGNRQSGERCRKGRFQPRAAEYRGYQVEVQLLTQLQEAWDKKDHGLIYEPVRRGEHVPEEHRILCANLSDQLFIADYQFEQLRQRHSRQEPHRASAPEEVPHAAAK